MPKTREQSPRSSLSTPSLPGQRSLNSSLPRSRTSTDEAYDSSDRSPSPELGNEAPGPTTKLACLKCRQRKIKCDRAEPRCSRCVKFNLSCIYPGRLKTKELYVEVSELKQQFESWEAHMEKLQSQLMELKKVAVKKESPPLEHSMLPLHTDSPEMTRSSSPASSIVDFNNSPMVQPKRGWTLSRENGTLTLEINLQDMSDLSKVVEEFKSFGEPLTCTPDIRPPPSTPPSARQPMKQNFLLQYGFGTTPLIDIVFQKPFEDISEEYRLHTSELRNRMENMLMEVFLNNGCCNNRVAILNKDIFLAQCHGPVENRPSAFLLSGIRGIAAGITCRVHGYLAHEVAMSLAEFFLKRCVSFMEDCFDDPTVDNIQSIAYVFMLSNVTRHTELVRPCTALMIRMVNTLGLHKKPDMSIGFEERERRARTFWWVWYQDFFSAVQYGGASAIDDSEVTAEIDIIFTGNLDEENRRYLQPYNVNAMRLARIMKPMMRDIFSHSADFDIEILPDPNVVENYRQRLEEFKLQLPTEIRFDPSRIYTKDNTHQIHLRSTIMLSCCYDLCLILLYSKFVPSDVGAIEDDLSPMTKEALEISLWAAFRATMVCKIPPPHELDGSFWQMSIYLACLLYLKVSNYTDMHLAKWARDILQISIRIIEQSFTFKKNTKNTRAYYNRLKQEVLKAPIGSEIKFRETVPSGVLLENDEEEEDAESIHQQWNDFRETLQALLK